MIITFKPTGVPKELKQYSNFVLWKKEKRDGKTTKVPYQLNGQKAKPNDSSTWSAYQDIEKRYFKGGYSGVGFCLSEGTPLGIDLDKCRCPAFADIPIVSPWAMDVIKQIDSYTEVSPSGRGIRIFAYGDKLPEHGRKRGAVEIYESGRYLTVTGHHLSETPTSIMQRPEEILAFHKQYFGTDADKAEIKIVQPGATSSVNVTLEKIFQSRNGDKIKTLYEGNHSDYPSQSEADLALCSHLAFWFNNDASAIDQSFRASGLFRPKWDKKHYANGQTYGQSVVEKAIQSTKETYTAEVHLNEKIGDDAVSRLAALSPIQYDQIRKEEAKKLGVRPTTLDTAVKDVRKGCEGEKLPFTDVEPWPESIEPDKVLTEISNSVRRFIICDANVSHAVSLWCAMTWFVDVVQVAPIALITAPEKRCGKTLLLSFLGKLSRRAIVASSISPAALFRTIEAWTPTLLIDEADAFIKDNEELRGLLNSGHTRDSAYVIRTVGENFTPTKFSTWGAKALAGIGHVADTIMDRSIVFELRRKLHHEEVEKIRYADPALFQDLRAKLARFAADYSDAVRDMRPPLPSGINDRAQDSWEPLLAIAATAGNEWLEIGTNAALKLSGGEVSSQTMGVELLSDIREIFSEKNTDRISTENLIKELCVDDEKVWATYNKGFPIKPRQLASKLKSYGIHSKTIRIGTETAKGYEKAQLNDAFIRYVPDTPNLSVTTSQPNIYNKIDQFLSVTQGVDVTDRNQDKCLIINTCYPVTDRIPQADGHKKNNSILDFTGESVEVLS